MEMTNRKKGEEIRLSGFNVYELYWLVVQKYENAMENCRLQFNCKQETLKNGKHFEHIIKVGFWITK